MRAPETFADLASELKAMSPRSRRQILGRLTTAEREKVERHLSAAPAASTSLEVPGSNPLSPWLIRTIEAARAGTSPTMAPRTQDALVRIADSLRRPNAVPLGQELKREPGRSLMEAFDGMLPTRRMR